MQLGTLEKAFDWRQSYDFERIRSVAEVHQRIERAKSTADNVTSSLLLGLVDAVASPLMGGLSSLEIAKAAQPITAKLGIRTGKERREFVTLPSGEVLANLAVALASIEHSLTSIEFGDHYCHIQATLPPDLRAFEVRLSVNIEGTEAGIWITAVAQAEGQWYDWGKCQSRLDRLFSGMRAA